MLKRSLWWRNRINFLTLDRVFKQVAPKMAEYSYSEQDGVPHSSSDCCEAGTLESNWSSDSEPVTSSFLKNMNYMKSLSTNQYGKYSLDPEHSRLILEHNGA